MSAWWFLFTRDIKTSAVCLRPAHFPLAGRVSHCQQWAGGPGVFPPLAAGEDRLLGHDCGQGRAAASPAADACRSVSRPSAASRSPSIAFPGASRHGAGPGGQPGGSPAPGQQPGTGPPSRCLPKIACVASVSLKGDGCRFEDRKPRPRRCGQHHRPNRPASGRKRICRQKAPIQASFACQQALWSCPVRLRSWRGAERPEVARGSPRAASRAAAWPPLPIARSHYNRHRQCTDLQRSRHPMLRICERRFRRFCVDRSTARMTGGSESPRLRWRLFIWKDLLHAEAAPEGTS